MIKNILHVSGRINYIDMRHFKKYFALMFYI
jgi:hypothetical protein